MKKFTKELLIYSIKALHEIVVFLIPIIKNRPKK